MNKEDFDEWRTRPETKAFIDEFIDPILDTLREKLHARAENAATLFTEPKHQMEFMRLSGFQDAFNQMKKLLTEGMLDEED